MSQKPEEQKQPEEGTEFRVDDRRHWASEEDEATTDEQDGAKDEVAPQTPTIIDEYRARAEKAEEKLHEYIDAFKQFRVEQDQVRERLRRDVDRRVQLQFGDLVSDLLGTVDDLDLALAHVGDDAASQNLAQGVSMVRNKFIETLERRGVERMTPDGDEFDPNVAEAIRVDPVDSAELNGRVTETLRPGYRVGEHVIRAAQVAVGRHDGNG